MVESSNSRKRSFRLRAEVDTALDEIQGQYLLRSRTEAVEACIEIAYAALDDRRAAPVIEKSRYVGDVIDIAPLVMAVNRIGVNINQTTRKLHSGEVEGTAALQSQMKDLEEILRTFKIAVEGVSS